MSALTRSLLAGVFLVTSAVVPGLGQNTGTAKIVPKLEPVAETKLIMEGLLHSNFRGLERNLNKNPMDDQTWVFARGQALLIAESANLLMLRPPRNSGEPLWMERSMDLRAQAQQMAKLLSGKDLERVKAGMSQVSNSCNRCHQTFRVPVEIVPFQQPDVPAPPLPGRKV
jgi:hypothetical protein